MSRNSNTKNPATIRQDFEDAIDRLKHGRPQNPELRAKLKKGKPVLINISNTALEAGRARSLIAREDCQYPDIRHRIQLEAGAVSESPRNQQDVVSDLRKQISELRAELAKVAEHAAYHQEQRQKAENVLEYEKQRADRQNREIKRLTKLLVETKKSSKVVQLRPS